MNTRRLLGQTRSPIISFLNMDSGVITFWLPCGETRHTWEGSGVCDIDRAALVTLNVLRVTRCSRETNIDFA